MSIIHYPQTDKQTERMHRTLEQIIRAHVLESGNETMQVSYLPFVEFTINSSTLDSTGKALFELVLGAILPAPVDRLDGMHRIESAQDFVSRLEKAILEAQVNMKKSQKYQKKYFDRSRRPTTFESIMNYIKQFGQIILELGNQAADELGMLLMFTERLKADVQMQTLLARPQFLSKAEQIAERVDKAIFSSQQ